MAEKQFALPDLGEGLTEADLVTWEVAVGDTVTLNQVIAEVETAKALVQLPSPYAGVVARLLVEAGTTVQVGTPIIAVDVPADADGSADGAAPRPSPTHAEASLTAATPARTSVLVGYGPPVEGGARPARRPRATRWTASHDGGAHAPEPPIPPLPPASSLPPATPGAAGRPAVTTPAGSAPADAVRTHARSRPAERPRSYPPVRRLAHELGVDLVEVTGTGEDGLITRDDVLTHAHRTRDGGPAADAAQLGGPTAGRRAGAGAGELDGAAAGPGVVAAPNGAGQPLAAEREVRTPVTGVRKHTAAAMVASAFTAPHATEFLTVDVTPSVELLADLAADRRFAGHRITVLALVAKALTVALRRTPECNAHWDEDAGEIVRFGYVDLGIAAATPRGLLVPVVRDAERLDLAGLADAIGALAHAARAGTTPPADLAGGTITVTNIGVFGIDAGTPILVPGQAAILATGAVRRLPWEHRGEIALRNVMTLSLSFDHRLVDGEQASRLLADVGEILARPAMLVTMV